MAVQYHTHTFEIPVASKTETGEVSISDKVVVPSSLGTMAVRDAADFPAIGTQIIAGDGLTGGGSLAANVTLALSSTSLASLGLANTAVQPTRQVLAGTGMSGGGNLAADVTVSLSSSSQASLALANTSIQPSRQVLAGAGMSGGGNLSADVTLALSSASQASLALANTSVQPARAVNAGTGLTGGGDLSTNRTIALSAASIASLASADSAVQPGNAALVPSGGSTGEVLAKTSASDFDTEWVAIEAATAVSYGPQTLSEAQQKQARENIGILDPGPSYLGVVASHCRTATVGNSAGANKYSMSRSRHYAKSDITSLQLLFANWFIDADDVEKGSGGVMTIRASIEYPAGAVPIQVLFSASASGSIADGAELLSDPLNILIPEGAEFFVRSYQAFTGSGAIIYSTAIDWGNEVMDVGATSGDVPDLTLGGNIVYGGAGDAVYRPTAILGQTTRPTALIIGDSRNEGFGDRPNAVGNAGYAERGLARIMGTLNAARNGDTVQGFVGSHTKRQALAQYVSDVFINYGINDINAGRTGAQVTADLVSACSYFPDKRVHLLTVEPRTTSTDQWQTTTGQTVNPNNAHRVTLNTNIRAGAAGSALYFDLADVLESSRNSGLWKAAVPPLTADGLHATRHGYDLAEAEIAGYGRSLFLPSQRPPNSLIAGFAEVFSNNEFGYGTFRPALVGTTTKGTGTYLIQEGEYQKIGRICFFRLRLRWTAHTGTGNMAIEGIPFLGDIEPASTVVSVAASDMTFSGQLTPQVEGNGNFVTISVTTSAGVYAGVPMDTNAIVHITGWYFDGSAWRGNPPSGPVLP